MPLWTALVALLATTATLSVAYAQVGPDAGCTMGALTPGEDRVFCEPLESSTFLQFAHFEAGLQALEEAAPDLIDVKAIGTSIEGRPIYFVEVTNEASPVPREDRLQLGYSASIHANEAAGREGMARMVEDLVRGVGPHGADLQPLLDRLIVNVWFPNPDSWASGDYFSASSIAAVHECGRGPVPLVGGPAVGYCSGFDRENANGTDLNRQFPNPGIIHTDHAPMSEPESRAVVSELRFSGNHSNLVAGMDLHGMIDSPNMVRAIIPNQDYDLRRMVLAVDMLRTMQERIEADPAFAEWRGMADLLATVDGLELPACGEDPTGIAPVPGCPGTGDVHGRPMEWGARWDMIGYTDTGFTSDYLMLSPRSPTGGMGAIGTITEFAYSHAVPDNKYVAKLTDMHVAGVRHMVRTQMELALRLETPVLSGTGPVGYAWIPDSVSSKDDPHAYEAGRAFDRDDPDTWFDFDQVPYDVSNLDFWRDLGRFTTDPVTPIDVSDGLEVGELEGLRHFVVTDQAFDAIGEGPDRATLDAWVQAGGHLLVTDSALRFFEGVGFDVRRVDTYLGHTDVQDWDHPLVAGVDWDARVTGEGPAIGMQVGRHYPQWVVDVPSGASAGFEVVGTTEGGASLGRYVAGEGTVDLLGGALPRPVQDHAPCGGQCAGVDHRYGLAGYSVSAFTYWIVANSLGGTIAWEPLDEPFVPTYDFDPLAAPSIPEPDPGRGSPMALPVALAAIVLALASRRRGPAPGS